LLIVHRSPFIVLKRFWFVIFWAGAALGIFELLLPLYGRALGLSTTTVGWLFGVFSFTGLALRLVLGRLLDRAPRRPVLLGGLLLYVVVFAIFAVAEGTGTLIVARLLQGIASTAVWLTAAVLVAEWAPAGQQGGTFGRYQVVLVWGAALGATWGGLALGLLDADTRVALEAALQPLDALYLIAWLPAPRAALDVLHLVFAGNAVFAFIALLGALLVSEPTRAQATPAVPSLARPPLALNVSGLLSGVAAGLLLPVVVLVIDDRFGVGGAGVGIVYAVPGIVYAIAPEPLGRLADRWGLRTAAIVGLLGVALSYAVFPWVPTVVFAVLALCGEAIGMSLASPALLALVGGDQAHRTGSAYGWYTSANVLGVAIGSPLGGWLYERALPAPFTVASLCTVLAALVLRLGSERRSRRLVEAVNAQVD
jgi:MFS family permease